MIAFVKLENGNFFTSFNDGSNFDGEYDGLEVVINNIKKRKIFKANKTYVVNNYFSYSVKHGEKDKKTLVLYFEKPEEIVREEQLV